MGENKKILKALKYVVNNQKNKFILIYGVLIRGFIVIFTTSILFRLLEITIGDLSAELNEFLILLAIKVILGLIVGYITGLIKWNYYRSIIYKNGDKKAYKKFVVLDGIVGWGLIMWIIQLEVHMGQLLRNIAAEALSLIIWSFIGACLGLVIWDNMDIDKIRKIVRNGASN